MKTKPTRYQLITIACLLLAGFFGVRAVIGSRHDSTPPTKVLKTKDIEQVKVFGRLLGHNPIVEDTHRDLAEPDPATWRVLELSMRKSNGKPLDITLARPIAWIEAIGAHTGGTIDLNLPEMGAVGAADVIAIRPCPPLRAGPGNVVTGTFAHEPDDNLINIYVEGTSDPIGCTPNHRFWSETAQSFVEAGDLHAGDTVRTRASGVVRIASITPRPFEDRVYNLEVHGEHVYEVALTGVLVHNNYETGAPSRTAFGLRDSLDDFAEGVNARRYSDIYDPAEDIIGGNSMLERRLRGMMDDADELHVDLSGMSNRGQFHSLDDLLEAGREGVFDGNVTNWEVTEIFDNFRGKTRWWYNGQDVTDIIDDFVF